MLKKDGFIDLNDCDYVLKEKDKIVLLYTGSTMPGLKGTCRIEEILKKDVMSNSCATFQKTPEGFLRYEPTKMQDYKNLIIYTVKELERPHKFPLGSLVDM